MAPRFVNNTLSIAVLAIASIATLGIAVRLVLAGTTTASRRWSGIAGAVQLDPPAAPSNCRTGDVRIRDRRKGDYAFSYLSWRDNSSNEDGFMIEEWWQNESGEWALASSSYWPANSTRASLGDEPGPDFRFRVAAYNASGDSAWSEWTH